MAKGLFLFCNEKRLVNLFFLKSAFVINMYFYAAGGICVLLTDTVLRWQHRTEESRVLSFSAGDKGLWASAPARGGAGLLLMCTSARH